MKKLLLIPCTILLYSCDPISNTWYIIQNRLDQTIEVRLNFSDQSILQPDTTILLPSNTSITYVSIEKLGRENFEDFQIFADLYDSILAVKPNSMISKNLLDESEWVFGIKSNKSAEYRLIIDESDF